MSTEDEQPKEASIKKPQTPNIPKLKIKSLENDGSVVESSQETDTAR